MALPPLRLRSAVNVLLLAGAALLAAWTVWLDPGHGWVLGIAAVGGAWLGWGLRQTWVYPRALARAEAAWAAGAPASEVAELLAPAALAAGEVGHGVHRLLGLAHGSLGYRDRAWLDHLQAQLARLPWWLRPLVARTFRAPDGTPSPRRLARVERLLRWAPGMGRLHHLQGILLLRTGRPDAGARAWAHFEAALPLCAEDPPILEDLLLAGLQQGRPQVAEEALSLLCTRHGDPRIPWDRGTAGMHLLRTGRAVEALALVQGLPYDRRGTPLPWLVEAAGRRQLGDGEGAWRSIEAAVGRLPASFRLWMERHAVALDLDRDAEALHSLDHAWNLIPADGAGEAERHEWLLRRAEFAFWWEDDPAFARELLDQVPPGRRGSHHPPLDLQLQVAEGHYEAAHAAVGPLLQAQPQDPDLLLLQADCLAGMAAWEALMPYLEGLGEACRQRPVFWHLRGLARAHLGDRVPARVDLERAVRMDPQEPRYLLDAGHACAELGDWDRAEGHWRQALRLEPEGEEALIHLAEARRELEDLEGARRYLRECLLHHPESPEAQARLAELEAN